MAAVAPEKNPLRPLDYTAAGDVPDSHVWFPFDESKLNDISGTPADVAVPVIDLAAPLAAQFDKVRIACEKTGMFQVINHGVPPAVIAAAEEQCLRLFNLPAELKQAALRQPGPGSAGYGHIPIQPFFAKKMWHEGFTIHGSPADLVKNYWPETYLEFCDVMDTYQNAMHELARKTAIMILESMGAAVAGNIDLAAYMGTRALQLNYYPVCPDPTHALGLAPHTDTTVVTVLHQNYEGLQVFEEGEGWVEVSPVAGGLVINIGDFLHMMSNGRFASALHRVIPDKMNERISMAFFTMPLPEQVVAPLMLKSVPFPKFRSVAMKDFMKVKYEQLYKAIPMMKIA
ncbi:gibberellin 3-beta-dioxygenase 1-like [Andrographis paniculata]|uniref:gibberellin 3-beta-dioxygenase 1-like n=1 Tax=Andrographis paniculata TaxID=175694 RepID=UPI0021E84A0C|nr:gibberellin 3-beta-dioxygenase 1-like [Andrographis paniculata]